MNFYSIRSSKLKTKSCNRYVDYCVVHRDNRRLGQNQDDIQNKADHESNNEKKLWPEHSFCFPSVKEAKHSVIYWPFSREHSAKLL